MINDSLTLLYYTAHTLPEHCLKRVRDNLSVSGEGYEIISVSQKPIDFGRNICVGDIGKSYYNCYGQIYTGLKEVKTKYVATCEDDTLYNKEHFSHRPDTISYNKSMWYLEKDRFWHKGWTGMFACIAPTDLLLEVLEKRFKECPEEPMPRRSQRHIWVEPGRVDGVPVSYFETKVPLITLNYFDGLGGKATSRANKPQEREKLDYFGRADELFVKLWK